MRIALATVLALTAVPVAVPVIAQTAQPGVPNKAAVTSGTYAVDPFHTQVTWQVNHMGFSMLEGQLGASGGSIVIDAAKPANDKVSVDFAIDQLSVTAAPFAGHLKSKDFFDAATYPTAKFVSTKVVVNGTKATITGDLTLKGVTKPVVLAATFIGAGPNPMSKKLNFGFRATTTIKRSDFGIGAYAPVVSDNVDLTINAAFTAQ